MSSRFSEQAAIAMSVHTGPAHPRLSALSTASFSTSADHLPSISNISSRYSLPPGAPNSASASPAPRSRTNIYDRNLNKTRTAEVSLSAFAFLFSEMVQYSLKRVNGIADLERRYAADQALTRVVGPHSRRLNSLGYRVGLRALELMTWRTEGAAKAPKREIRFVPALLLIQTQLWRAVFGKHADNLEKSVENEDECASSLRLARGARF